MSLQQFDELLQKYSEYANYKSLENKIKYSSIFNQVSLPDTEFILNRLECAEMTCIASLEYHHRNDIIEAVNRLHAMKEFDSKAMYYQNFYITIAYPIYIMSKSNGIV